jgi:Bax protein
VKKLSDENIAFIVKFYPGIAEANEHIREQRKQILKYKNDYPDAVKRSRIRKRLNKMAAKYRLGDTLFNSNLTHREFLQRIDSLLYRVNIIPEKLIMAQAIIESGWGKSKYARTINNYFGIHCYTPGCGQAPSALTDPDFYVKAFPSIEACIEEYMWLLNTGFAFENLRSIRQKLIEKNRTPDAISLSKGLERYSEKGLEYVTLVQTIIKNYLPKNLNDFVEFHLSTKMI